VTDENEIRRPTHNFVASTGLMGILPVIGKNEMTRGSYLERNLVA
jgi:hypothetical protein